MNKSSIEWTDYTWNPITGCLHDCEYCYARSIARRFTSSRAFERAAESGNSSKCFVLDEPIREPVLQTCEHNPSGHYVYKPNAYPYGFDPTFHRYRLNEPHHHKNSKTVFVGSMTDIFGEWVPDEWIQEVFKACEAAPWHKYLFLTKNPARYIRLSNNLPNDSNHWYGMSIDGVHRETQFPYNENRFLSIEPLLSGKPLTFPKQIKFFKWVIIGAETGNRKGKIIPKREWIEIIVKACRENDVPVFLKNNLKEVWESCEGCEQNTNGCYGECRTLIQEFPWPIQQLKFADQSKMQGAAQPLLQPTTQEET